MGIVNATPNAAIEKRATRFRVDEELYRVLLDSGLPLVISVAGGEGQRVHPYGTYVIPNDVAVRFIESKREYPNWRTHRNFHSYAIPVPLRPYFRPA